MSVSKIRDAILSLTLAGVWLLMPPMLDLFNQPVLIFGVPLIVIYVFGALFLLILATALMARALPGDRDGDGGVEPDPLLLAEQPDADGAAGAGPPWSDRRAGEG